MKLPRPSWSQILGCALGVCLAVLLIRLTPSFGSLSPAARVGFAMTAVLAGCLFVLFLGNAVRIDGQDERLETLERRDQAVWDHLGIEETDGWPEDEPAPVEPQTQPIPVVPRTEPMQLGDEIEADFRASQVQAEQPQRRMVEKTVAGMTFRVWEDVQ